MTQPSPTPPPLSDDPLLRDVPDVDGWKILPPVVLQARIAQGGMGAVYRGTHADFEIDVAVKCLIPSRVDGDNQSAEGLRSRARLAAGVAHENLVRLYDLRHAHGLIHLILEFVEGETAFERGLRKGPMREEEAAMIVLGATRGLAAAHRHSPVVVHGNIKPQNIFVSARGEVKLADLGVARMIVTGPDSNLGAMGMLCTPAYIAPEQWDDASSIGPRTDVWAMGETLYCLLTARTPIRSGPAQAHRSHLLQEMRTLRPDLSQGLRRILERCAELNPSDRYADAGFLADDLERFLAGRGASIWKRLLGRRLPSLADRELGERVKRGRASRATPPAHVLRLASTTLAGKSLPSGSRIDRAE